ncbi:MAG: mannose-1-phosphate guanyltransferase, partial [Verrucomicrobia bacterium]|nr:mannose-1-phosphate guanyltransferase [Verrucomicrobiota bacterium]MBV9671584.1 mannose-1-phosphate guanyltransferase [Verrucomicrobiota bacterium]
TLERATDNIVYCDDDTHVALLGVSDLIVVSAKGAILVCHRRDVEQIKKVVSSIPEKLQ